MQRLKKVFRILSSALALCAFSAGSATALEGEITGLPLHRLIVPLDGGMIPYRLDYQHAIPDPIIVTARTISGVNLPTTQVSSTPLPGGGTSFYYLIDTSPLCGVEGLAVLTVEAEYENSPIVVSSSSALVDVSCL